MSRQPDDHDSTEKQTPEWIYPGTKESPCPHCGMWGVGLVYHDLTCPLMPAENLRSWAIQFRDEWKRSCALGHRVFANAQRWEGKFRIVCHENNKLRKRAAALGKDFEQAKVINESTHMERKLQSERAQHAEKALRQVQAERDEACKHAELAESADKSALTQCQDSLDKQLSLTKKLRNEIRVLWQRLRDANRGAECSAKVAWGMAKELAQVQAERDEALKRCKELDAQATKFLEELKKKS